MTRRRKIRVLKRRRIYQGRIIELVLETIESRGHRLQRETVLHPGAAVVVPMLGSRVVLVKQYRRAVDRELLELPAGTLDHGEAPIRCARRELEEETGWRAKRFRKLVAYYAAPGFTSEHLTVYLATGLTPSTARPEPDEHLRPVIMPFSKALRLVRRGAIKDSKTIIGLLFAQELCKLDSSWRR